MFYLGTYEIKFSPNPLFRGCPQYSPPIPPNPVSSSSSTSKIHSHTTHKIHSHPSKNKFLSIFCLDLNIFDANQPCLEAKSTVIGVDSPLSLYFLLLHFLLLLFPLPLPPPLPPLPSQVLPPPTDQLQLDAPLL
jgi:hypothetical protein